jgi:hypothetical protein
VFNDILQVIGAGAVFAYGGVSCWSCIGGVTCICFWMSFYVLLLLTTTGAFLALFFLGEAFVSAETLVAFWDFVSLFIPPFRL